MLTKADHPVPHLRTGSTLPLIEVYFEFNHLKQLFRQGWLQCNIAPDRCESVAEHTYAVTFLAMLLADAHFPELDLMKVMRIALLHDFGEIYAGDITPRDNVPPEEKQRLERESVERVLGKLPNGERYIALWEEYENEESPESKFVHQIDRLEMVLQATVYEHQGTADLSEFFEFVRHVLEEPELIALFDEIRTLREKTPSRTQ